MKVDKKVLVPVAIAGVAIGIYFLTRAKTDNQTYVPVPSPAPTNGGTTVTITLDRNKILKRGVNGLETKELQKLLGVTADGIFAAQTEAALVAIKGVTFTTLNQYAGLVTINQNPVAIGSKVMANLRAGTPIHNAEIKADGSTYSDYKIVKYIDYGQYVGTVKDLNPTKTWYMIEYPGFFGIERGFVKSTDVVKI